MISIFWQNNKTFFKYALTGFLVSIGELWFLHYFVEVGHWWYLAASSVTFASGLIASFWLRKFLVFKDYGRQNLWRQLFFYALIWLVNSLLNFILMYALVEWAVINYLWAQIFSNLLVGFIGFFFNKLVTFKPSPLARVSLRHHHLWRALKR